MSVRKSPVRIRLGIVPRDHFRKAESAILKCRSAFSWEKILNGKLNTAKRLQNQKASLVPWSRLMRWLPTSHLTLTYSHGSSLSKWRRISTVKWLFVFHAHRLRERRTDELFCWPPAVASYPWAFHRAHDNWMTGWVRYDLARIWARQHRSESLG